MPPCVTVTCRVTVLRLRLEWSRSRRAAIRPPTTAKHRHRDDPDHHDDPVELGSRVRFERTEGAERERIGHRGRDKHRDGNRHDRARERPDRALDREVARAQSQRDERARFVFGLSHRAPNELHDHDRRTEQRDDRHDPQRSRLEANRAARLRADDAGARGKGALSAGERLDGAQDRRRASPPSSGRSA